MAVSNLNSLNKKFTINSVYEDTMMNKSYDIFNNFFQKAFDSKLNAKVRTKNFLIKKLKDGGTEEFFKENIYPNDVLIEGLEIITDMIDKDPDSIPRGMIGNFGFILENSPCSYEFFTKFFDNSKILKTKQIELKKFTIDAYEYLMKRLPVLPLELLNGEKIDGDTFFKRYRIDGNGRVEPILNVNHSIFESKEYTTYLDLLNIQVKSIGLNNIVNINYENVSENEMKNLGKYLIFNENPSVLDIFKKAYTELDEKKNRIFDFSYSSDVTNTVNTEFKEYLELQYIKQSYIEDTSNTKINGSIVEKMIDSYEKLSNPVILRNIVKQISDIDGIYSDKILTFIYDSTLLNGESDGRMGEKVIEAINNKSTITEIDREMFEIVKNEVVQGMKSYHSDEKTMLTILKSPLFTINEKTIGLDLFLDRLNDRNKENFNNILDEAKQSLGTEFDNLINKFVSTPNLFISALTYLETDILTNKDLLQKLKENILNTLDNDDIFPNIVKLDGKFLSSSGILQDKRFIDRFIISYNESVQKNGHRFYPEGLQSTYANESGVKDFYRLVLSDVRLTTQAMMNINLDVLSENLDILSEKLPTEDFTNILALIDNRKDIDNVNVSEVYKNILSNKLLNENQLSKFPLNRIVENIDIIANNKIVKDISVFIDLIEIHSSNKQNIDSIEILISKLSDGFSQDIEVQKILKGIFIIQSRSKGMFPFTKEHLLALQTLYEKDNNIFKTIMTVYCNFKSKKPADIDLLINLYNTTKFDFIHTTISEGITSDILDTKVKLDFNLAIKLAKKQRRLEKLLTTSNVEIDLTDKNQLSSIISNFNLFSFNDTEKEEISKYFLLNFKESISILMKDKYMSNEKNFYEFFFKYITPKLKSNIDKTVVESKNIIMTRFINNTNEYINRQLFKDPALFSSLKSDSKLGLIKLAQQYGYYGTDICKLFPKESKVTGYTDQILSKLEQNPEIMEVVGKDYIGDIIMGLTREQLSSDETVEFIEKYFKYLDIPYKLATLELCRYNTKSFDLITDKILTISEKLRLIRFLYKERTIDCGDFKKSDGTVNVFSSDWKRQENIENLKSAKLTKNLINSLPKDILSWLSLKDNEDDDKEIRKLLFFAEVFLTDMPTANLSSYKVELSNIRSNNRRDDLINEIILPLTKKIGSAKFVMRLSRIANADLAQEIIDELKKLKKI